MSSREQIRLELVKALLAQSSVQAITQYGRPDPSAGPYPGMLQRVDALEVIVTGGTQAHVTEVVMVDSNPFPTGWIPCDLSVAVYRKKPVVVAARQFVNNNDANADLDSIVGWITTNGKSARHDGTSIYIQTLEGEMRADIKDWIIRGVKGEFYPCKPDVFEATYEPVAPKHDPQRTSTTEKLPG